MPNNIKITPLGCTDVNVYLENMKSMKSIRKFSYDLSYSLETGNYHMFANLLKVGETEITFRKLDTKSIIINKCFQLYKYIYTKLMTHIYLPEIRLISDTHAVKDYIRVKDMHFDILSPLLSHKVQMYERIFLAWYFNVRKDQYYRTTIHILNFFNNNYKSCRYCYYQNMNYCRGINYNVNKKRQYICDKFELYAK